MNSVTHLVGIEVVIGGRQIQRCAICGDKIVDSRGMMAPVKPDGSPPDPLPFWKVGSLVRVTFNGPCSHWVPLRDEDLDEAGKLPKDSCIDLVES